MVMRWNVVGCLTEAWSWSIGFVRDQGDHVGLDMEEVRVYLEECAQILRSLEQC